MDVTLTKPGDTCTRMWRVVVDGAVMTTHWGIAGGAVQSKTVQFEQGRAGRTAAEQAMFEAAARLASKRGEGYGEDAAAAESCSPKPAAATRRRPPKQPNYDAPCVATTNDAQYPMLPVELTAALMPSGPVWVQGVPAGADIVLSGTNPVLAGWMGRVPPCFAEPDVFIACDVAVAAPFRVRAQLLREMAEGGVAVAAPVLVTSGSPLDWMDDARDGGYDALIVRPDDDTPYVFNRRNVSMLELRAGGICCATAAAVPLDVNTATVGAMTLPLRGTLPDRLKFVGAGGGVGTVQSLVGGAPIRVLV